jgi:tetratricopeptide (TPR) repeat protein
LNHCPVQSFIELGPLKQPDSNRLINILLEESGAEIEKLQDITFRFTAGNPFYIYEYLKSVIHTGIYAFDEDSKAWFFHEDRIHRTSLSTGVAALVSDRIRLLNPIDQALIGIASLAGQAMSRLALADILPVLLAERGLTDSWTGLQDKAQYLELAYQELLQKNLLVPDSHSFRFFHDKIQEASYGTLNEAERRVLHPAYGIWCVKHLEASERTNEAQIFEAAYHLCQGDQKILEPFACRFLINSAKLAQSVYAYEKAKDYLSAVIVAHEFQNVFSPQEKFEAMELLANTLTISDQVREALDIYDKLLEFECTSLQRASIFCKKSEFGLSILDFKQARDASIAGLEVLGAPYLIRISSSTLYMLFFFPILAIYAVYFQFFGQQTKEMDDEEEALKFQLQLKNQLSQHLLHPIVAIANLVMVTFDLLRYKECYARATVFCYWGVVLGPFGLDKLSSKLLATAYEYFDRTADPVSKGQLLYFWGFLCDYPAGNLTAAQKKLEEAVALLEPIGESFWRSMSLVGIITLDYFGSESGQAGIRSHELIEQFKRLRFEPTGLAFTLRYFQETEREDQVNYFMTLAHQSALKSHQTGFDSVEALMAWQCMGEYHELKGDYEVAMKYYRHATWVGALRLHRSGIIPYAPVALARVLIHKKRRLEALIPLVLSWFNQLMNARVFLPQTLFVTGYWLDAVGWRMTGQRVIEAGIKYASKRHWATVAAEGRLLLGRLMEDSWPEMALVNLQLAKECFQRRAWKFHIHICDQEMVRQRLAYSEKDITRATSSRSVTHAAKRGVGIRQKIEIKSLFDVLLKLSAISQKEALFRSLMESLCYATGSELAVLFFSEEDRWVPQVAYNLEMQSVDQFNSRVDMRFVDHCTSTQIREPLVRKPTDDVVGQNLTGGSAMIVPLIYEARIYGYCYLANTQIYDLFDEQSIEIAAPIAIQATIALQNIILNSELSFERDQIAELHRTLEQRVMEQTRDIKSIMQHINMGICTVSGSDILIDKDYSLFLETLLHESPLNGKAILPILLARSQLGIDEKDQVMQAIRVSMNELELAFKVNDHLLPRTLRGTSEEGSPYVFELDWIPIVNESHSVEKILITINDVTTLRALEQRANETDQEMKIVFEILNCGTREWGLFINSSEKLLQDNDRLARDLVLGAAGESALRKVFVNMHTIKGNARAIGCKVINETIHAIEQYFSQTIRDPNAAVQFDVVEQKLAEVTAIVHRYRDIAENKLGRTTQSRQTVTISRDRLLEFYSWMQANEIRGTAQPESLRLSLHDIRETLFLSVEATIQQLCVGLETLAIDLGKSKPGVKIDTGHIWATDHGNEVLRNCFMHLIRNSLDHGIETPDERVRLGKAAEGTIDISCQVQGQFVVFRLMDDGRGLNLRKIASMGVERGLLSEAQTKDDRAVAALIFSADFSTAETLTDISGRGVGMTAVAQYIDEVGGKIHIEFLENCMNPGGFRPFAFIISLPASLFQIDSIQLQSA